MNAKLVATTALASVFSLTLGTSAYSQTTPDTKKDHHKTKVHSDKSVQSHHDESMVILGGGASRQTQSLSHTTLQEAVPGTSPMKAISKLPGVMFTSSDPLGAYEWSQQTVIRGFDQSRIGFTMDGIPLGNQNYGNTNGMSVGRAVQTENNGTTTLSQGAGSIAIAASNDLGGALQFTSIDPSHKFGVDLAGTIGSASTWRSFLRINSGDLPGGGRFYVSYDHEDGNKWKGFGRQLQDQVNAKYIQPLGQHMTLTLFGDWSKSADNDYQDLSLSLIHQHGYKWDNMTKNYSLAQQIASAYQQGKPMPSGVGTQDDSYYNAEGLREDAFGYGKLDFDISSRLKGSITGYGHTNSGEGPWITPYVPTPASLGGSPLSTRTTEYDIHRAGFIGSLQYHIAHHHIEGGFWFENNNFEQARRYYPLNANSAPELLQSYHGNAFQTNFQGTFNTKTYQVHLGDVWDITKQLKLTYGFKSLISNSSARNIVTPYAVSSGVYYPTGSLSASNGFLPQIGIHYQITPNHEVFADYARNMATYDNAYTSGPFATTAAGFNYLKNRIHPETSNTEELGYRFHNKAIQASITGYYVEFENRLIAATQGVGIQGNPSILTNAGGVTTRGIETAFNWKFAQNWSLFASYSFNDSRYNDNVYAGGQLAVATKGKNLVNTPRNLANVQLGYDDGSLWGNVLMQFQDRRYYTYTNDAYVAPNDVFNLNVGYRFHGHDIWTHGLEMQVNVTNLFDKRYVATTGSTGFVNSDPSGSYQTLQAAAPRMVFFSIKKHFG